MTSHIHDADGSQASDDEVMSVDRDVVSVSLGADDRTVDNISAPNVLGHSTSRPHGSHAAGDSQMQRYAAVGNEIDEGPVASDCNSPVGFSISKQDFLFGAEPPTRTALDKEFDTVRVGSKNLDDLISAVDAIRKDTSRMVSILTATELERGQVQPEPMSEDLAAAMRWLASDIRKQSALVKELSGSVAAANYQAHSPTQFGALGSLSAMLCDAKAQLECISPQVAPGQKMIRTDSGAILDPPAHIAVGGQLATHALKPNEEHLSSMGSCHEEGDQRGDENMGDCPRVSMSMPSIRNEVRGPLEGYEREASQLAASRIPPQSLLQAALRDVLESSLLDVEAEMSEWQELKRRSHVTDMSSATLDGCRPSHSGKTRTVELSQLNALEIPFEVQDSGWRAATCLLPTEARMVQTEPPLHEDASAYPADTGVGCADKVPVVEETVAHHDYRDFVDAHMEQRIRMAENVMSKGKSGEGCSSMDALQGPEDVCGADSSHRDEMRLLEQYMQLSTDMAHCLSKLPILASAVAASAPAKKVAPSTARPAAAGPLEGATERPCALEGSPAAGEHRRGGAVRKQFCSPQDRAAMAERLGKKYSASFCSPLHRVALAEKLAKKADHRSGIEVHELASQRASSSGGDHSPVPEGDCTLVGVQAFVERSTLPHNVQAAGSGVAVPGADLAAPPDAEATTGMRGQSSRGLEVLTPALCAEAHMLHAELQSVSSELAAATSDLTHFAQLSAFHSGIPPLSRTVAPPVPASCDDAHITGAQDCATQTEIVAETTPREHDGVNKRARQDEACTEGVMEGDPRDDSCLSASCPECAAEDHQIDGCHAKSPVSKMAVEMCSPVMAQEERGEHGAGERAPTALSGVGSADFLKAACLQHIAPSEESCTWRSADARSSGGVGVPRQGKQAMPLPYVEMAVQDLTMQVRAVADVQASLSQGNQLLLEKTDGLIEGLQRSLGKLDRGQDAIDGAVSELICHISGVRTTLDGLRRSASDAQIPPPAEPGHCPWTSNVGTQTPAHVQTQTEARAVWRQLAPVVDEHRDLSTVLVDTPPCVSHLRAVDSSAAASQGAAIRQGERPPSLSDLQGLIADLQHVATDIKQSHNRHVERVQSRRERLADEDTICGSVAHAATTASQPLDGKGGEDTNEMERVLRMLREKAARNGSPHDRDELDLSSFGPQGPAS